MATRISLAKQQTAARRVLAANLRAERAHLKLSQERAAERVGLSLQYLQRIERCIVNVPLDTLVRFARGYGVEPADLLKPIGGPRR
jgi:transcriptional regulator with XRE-family HTH domain